MIRIRHAGADDASLIAAMSRSTFHDTFAEHNTPENMAIFMNDVFSMETLIAEVSSSGNLFLLAYDDEQPVGYVRLRTCDHEGSPGISNSLEIARIYIISSAIGTGAGSSLMARCIEIAKEKKLSTIWLDVWEKNYRAINFYTRWGFEKFGTHLFVLGNDPQMDWLMKKSVIASSQDKSSS